VYYTNIKRDYDKHILTAKHITNKEQNKTKEIIEEEKTFCCELCNKKYKSYVGLWKHNKICIVEPIKATQPSSQATQEPTTINEIEIKKYFEKNPEILLNIVKSLMPPSDQQQLVLYKNNGELIKFEENNLINEVIQVKEEVKKVEKKLNKRIDKLEQQLNFYTENHCANNIDYEIFVSDLPITHKFCKELSEDFFQLITEMLKKEIKKYGLENSPIYCMLNSKKQIVVKVKSKKMWNTYYHTDARLLTVIKEIIEPIINKIKLGISEYPDEKIKRKNCFTQHQYMLDDKTQQVGIMRYGLYEPIELNTRKIKRLTEKKNGIKENKNTDNEKDNEDDEDDEDDDKDEKENKE
jgi:hypothetical protein